MIEMQQKKLFIAITSPISIVLLKGQLKFFVGLGYDVYLLCPLNEETIDFAREEKAHIVDIQFKREISIFSDLLCVLRLVKIMIKHKPDIVNAGTPKASLLTLLAARITGVKKRIYTCRGLRFESERGVKRKVLVLMEKLTARSSHNIICISDSVLKKALEFRVFPKRKSLVLQKGSSNGIDLRYFDKTNKDIPTIDFNREGFIFGFIGRFIARKGVNELVKAFVRIDDPNSNLLMVGGFDEAQKPEESVIEMINTNHSIITVDWTNDIRPYLRKIDVLLLPAYWEGFGNVLIQAAAFGIPVIATKVSGCVDAVGENFNGLLIKPRSVDELHKAMIKYKNDSSLRTLHGENGKIWVQNFKQETLWNSLNDIYTS